jgi:hypothetical protein
MPMRVTPKIFAAVCRRMLPLLETVDTETQEVLSRICDERVEITRADATAIGVAYLLELRSRASSRRR